MARYIDADVLKGALIAKLGRDINEDKAVKGLMDGGYHIAIEDTLFFVSLMTPVEIVRCKDCKHFKKSPRLFGDERTDGACRWIQDRLFEQDFFCAFGEMKEKESVK